MYKGYYIRGKGNAKQIAHDAKKTADICKWCFLEEKKQNLKNEFILGSRVSHCFNIIVMGVKTFEWKSLKSVSSYFKKIHLKNIQQRLKYCKVFFNISKNIQLKEDFYFNCDL